MGRVRKKEMGQRPRPKLQSGPKRGRSVTIPSVLLDLTQVDLSWLGLNSGFGSTRFDSSAQLLSREEVTKTGGMRGEHGTWDIGHKTSKWTSSHLVTVCRGFQQGKGTKSSSFSHVKLAGWHLGALPSPVKVKSRSNLRCIHSLTRHARLEILPTRAKDDRVGRGNVGSSRL